MWPRHVGGRSVVPGCQRAPIEPANSPSHIQRTKPGMRGTTVPRLPGFTRWLWDGEFAGAINVRWQPGSTDLPPTCLGHIGYGVVPWKQRRGYATAALAQMLDELRLETDLPWVDITTDPDNTGSQKVIEANGGVLVGRFDKGAVYGDGECLRYRAQLD